MSLIEEFLKVITALWKKLATLEYIGQRKENIVVAEQQIVQQVQAKRTMDLAGLMNITINSQNRKIMGKVGNYAGRKTQRE